jgi:hypothetical protein
MAKNKSYTQGYFVKRLRDSGFYVIKIFDNYHSTDERRWTVLINPGNESIYITCYRDKIFKTPYFEFNDGAKRFPKNYQLKTDSLEVVVSHLIEHNVENKCPTSLDHA